MSTKNKMRSLLERGRKGKKDNFGYVKRLVNKVSLEEGEYIEAYPSNFLPNTVNDFSIVHGRWFARGCHRSKKINYQIIPRLLNKLLGKSREEVMQNIYSKLDKGLVEKYSILKGYLYTKTTFVRDGRVYESNGDTLLSEDTYYFNGDDILTKVDKIPPQESKRPQPYIYKLGEYTYVYYPKESRHRTETGWYIQADWKKKIKKYFLLLDKEGRPIFIKEGEQERPLVEVIVSEVRDPYPIKLGQPDLIKLSRQEGIPFMYRPSIHPPYNTPDMDS